MVKRLPKVKHFTIVLASVYSVPQSQCFSEASEVPQAFPKGHNGSYILLGRDISYT